jgi:hypothetical protein
MYLIGCVLLLSILGMARAPDGDAVFAQAFPSGQGWSCQWLDEPTISPGPAGNQCRGVVQCRHDTMQTLLPQVRKVTCSVQGDECDPSICFTQTIRTPPGARDR